MIIFKNIIYLALIACFIRGLFVFDQGGSAKDTYPTASAICFVGSISGAIAMFCIELWLIDKIRPDSKTHDNKTE